MPAHTMPKPWSTEENVDLNHGCKLPCKHKGSNQSNKPRECDYGTALDALLQLPEFRDVLPSRTRRQWRNEALAVDRSASAKTGKEISHTSTRMGTGTTAARMQSNTAIWSSPSL